MSKESAILEGAGVLPVARPMFPFKELLSLASRGGERLTGLVVPLLVLILWEVANRLAWVKPVFLPPPATVLTTLYDLIINGQFLADFTVSIITVLKGFIWGGMFGLLLGTAAGLSKVVERLFGPILNGIRQVPAIAWLPLIIMWVGIGDTGKVVVIGKSVFFPVFLNTLQGIRNVSREYLEVGRVYEFTRFQMLRRVVFPAAMPAIFVGIRFGAGLAWAMIVAAEMLSGRKGLGFLLLQAQDLLMTDQVFVVIVVIGLVGYLIDLFLRQTEKRLLRWQRANTH